MPVIIVAAGLPETSERIARQVAGRLAYDLFGPTECAAAANDRGLSGQALFRALDPRQRLLGLSSTTRSRQLAILREVTLARLDRDRVVCHGVAAHLFVHGVSHVLKVRMLENPAVLVNEVASRERVTTDKASRLVGRRAAARRRWSTEFFGVDESDPSLYDLAIKLSQISEEQAVEIIASTARDRAFQPMSYSQAVLHDLWVVARARTAVLERFPAATVERRDGVLTVTTTATEREQRQHVDAIRELLAGLPDVGDVVVNASIDYVREAAESLR